MTAPPLPGEAYVLFGNHGSGTGGTFELSTLAGGGGTAGISVDLAGDVNGDAMADLLVGAVKNSPNGVTSGQGFVLFGREPLILASLGCTPASGTVPFSTQMTVSLDNLYTGQTRRIAGRIDVTLAGGGHFPGWRAGYTNVPAGGSYFSSWATSIPALGTVIGENSFTLVAEDVTPAPYNQPPYPAAGDSHKEICLVTGVAP